MRDSHDDPRPARPRARALPPGWLLADRARRPAARAARSRR